jgi:catechol 2,3-dioxygenase-like lactoylglutathione lyase family enzyme
MAFTFERLHHVLLAIPPGGEDVARAFYGGVLGMTELAKPESLRQRGGCWFRGGGWEVHLGAEKDFVAARARRTRASSSTTSTPWPPR